MKALLIGSISTLADTSELQRAAFNQAFHEAGLDWHWSQGEYRAQLAKSGGRDRIAAYAENSGTDVDADALHARKTEIFQQKLRSGAAEMRDQTQAALEYARQHGLKAAFVSGTAKESLAALVDGFGGAEALGFDLITSRADGAPKPAPDLYAFALDRLGVAAEDALAIEDNVPGLQAAQKAGVTCLAYPNENTANHDFGDAEPASRWSAYLRPDAA